MFHNALNKKDGTALLLFLPVGYRQVALYVEKHEQFTPDGREPFIACSHVNDLAVSTGREQGLEVQVISKSLFREQERRVNNW